MVVVSVPIPQAVHELRALISLGHDFFSFLSLSLSLSLSGHLTDRKLINLGHLGS